MCLGGVCSVPHRAPVPAHADLSEPLLVAEQAVSRPSTVSRLLPLVVNPCYAVTSGPQPPNTSSTLALTVSSAGQCSCSQLLPNRRFLMSEASYATDAG